MWNRLPPALAREPLAWLCVPLCLGAVYFLFVNLGSLPFWVDESIAIMPAKNVHVALRPTSPFDLDFMPWQLKYGLWDPATPLYRYVVGGFTALTGFSEVTTRAFSVLMGIASSIPLFALVRRIYGPRAALLSVTFLLTSATFMIFAREARHFTFVLFLALCTVYYLYVATEGGQDASKALWFVFLVATLLSQTLGYGVLPAVALYALWNGPRRFLSWRYAPVYAAAAGLYLAVLAVFWDTLPFFHQATCENRPAGCQRSVLFYPAVLYGFLSPLTERYEWNFVKVLALPPILFLAGFALVMRDAVRGQRPRGQASLLPIWFLVPLLLLSSREVKFPRYLFIQVMPLCALFPALAIDAVAGSRRLARAAQPLAAALTLLVVFSPQIPLASLEQGRLEVRSGIASFLQRHVLGVRDDNWERIRWQADFLNARMEPGDVVVTSFDDASLQFYVDRFVYGFLNSRHSDAFMNGLLDRAEREGSRLFFIDTLPNHNYCLTDEPEPRTVDCRVKFETFYRRCLTVRACGGPEPACVHVPVQ